MTTEQAAYKELTVKGDLVLGQETLLKKFQADRDYKIKKYDFRRPDKFSKDQIRTLLMIHETFARLSSTSLSAQLRTLCNMHVACVDQCTFSEFTEAVPNPTLLSVLNMNPLRGSAILEVNPSLTYAMIDRLFGGRGEDNGITREATDIELSVMEGMVVRLAGNLREAWSTVIDLKPHLGNIETNPQFAQIVPPNNMVVLVTFETTIGDVKGWINLCIPYITIEPLLEKLSAQYWYSSAKKGDSKGDARLIAGLELNADISLSAGCISLRDLDGLKKGSMIRLESADEKEAVLSVGNTEPVALAFLADKSFKEWTFKVVPTTTGPDEMEEILNVQDQSTRAASQMEKVIVESMDNVSRMVGGQIERLQKNVEQLSMKHEELSTQIGLASSAGTGGPIRTEGAQWKPFDIAAQADSNLLITFIRGEHPQTIALIVSYLDPQKASRVLADLPAALQADVARRIAVIDRTSPDVIHEVERVLERKFNILEKENTTSVGGIDAIVEVLNLADRSTEKAIMESLERGYPQLAEEIKRRMFVFEDIVLLREKDVRKIFERCVKQDLLLAVKAVSEEVKAFILRNLPENFKKGFAEEVAALDRVRLNEVEASQQRIVNVIREMELNGEIIVARSDEQLV